MKLTLRRYSWLLVFQLALLLADLFFNAFGSWLARDKLQTAIFFFVVQDSFIIIEYLLFTLSLHSTCVYQVGASHIILRNCKLFLFSITIYFLLSASQHSWIVYQYRLSPSESTQQWPLALYALAVFQRLMSVLYYYTSKSTALIMADPRYKEEHLDWIAEQLGDK
ncbi:transmembrane protein 138-like [Drosophila sulfurigaster albostrigata]|uniref:transmembrane protein 138-like n=1 Tax=Drosophila sulfurigaster albostrigata TaxID=89887 RepID=UPI002D21B2D5|nr:transmembrane protein 138-like [Drosophila sulfurigaster albostrigata]